MALHLMAKLADRRLVRHSSWLRLKPTNTRMTRELYKASSVAGSERLKPVLGKVDTQHTLNPDWPTTSALRIRIEGFYGFGKPFLGNSGFHVIQKLFLAGFLAKFFKAVDQELLFHIWKTQL